MDSFECVNPKKRIVIHGMELPKKEIIWIAISPEKCVAWTSKDAFFNAKPDVVYAEEEEEACEWILKKGMIYCPECAEGFDAINMYDFKHCPNCGAKMTVENQ